MGQKIETSPESTGRDRLIWSVIVLLVGASVVANYYYSETAWALRAAGWILVVCSAGALALLTAQGRHIKEFSKESRIELRKVVWPTRQETMQSTMIVVMMVVITAILLWAIDSVLMWLIAMFTG
ncbi:MAG: preprotein translocase subunit SecE [Gammaproteobacteria bacterium]|nr:preprotein translocase subunit SecE [Gammaproteobacteria bacterium]